MQQTDAVWLYIVSYMSNVKKKKNVNFPNFRKNFRMLNSSRKSISFLPKCEKRGRLVRPTFFGTFFGKKNGKTSAATKKIEFLGNRQTMLLLSWKYVYIFSIFLKKCRYFNSSFNMVKTGKNTFCQWAFCLKNSIYMVL